MSIDPILDTLLQQAGLPEAANLQGLGGGCINDAFRVPLVDDTTVFLKRHRSPPTGFFEAEAAGLAAMLASDSVRVPRVLAVAEEGLLLEWLSGSPGPGFAEELGAQLAGMHRTTDTAFGFSCDNFCGLTPQPNPRMADGHAFFGEARLLHQGRLARDQGLLGSADMTSLERIAARLPEWIPVQPASLIHGDLWGGNVHAGPDGEPVLIDPAAHYGWAEADLAMTTLFGRQPTAFYEAYAAHSELAPDWEERIPLYNLYHLLNHLNLFGGGYAGSVRAVLKRFGS
ncbi:fructosamine kinase family protein [Marinobacter sp. JSM 1782161]|uniref:fructosamine kinase family protein n=1 Tax=Marinobacter sp. JSM 1782161 TaxID=2685906 RepID=UPI001401E878|nr:fructosamine kinase family protein [Marinobacter sp. JSM 1782161]